MFRSGFADDDNSRILEYSACSVTPTIQTKKLLA